MRRKRENMRNQALQCSQLLSPIMRMYSCGEGRSGLRATAHHARWHVCTVWRPPREERGPEHLGWGPEAGTAQHTLAWRAEGPSPTATSPLLNSSQPRGTRVLPLLPFSSHTPTAFGGPLLVPDWDQQPPSPHVTACPTLLGNSLAFPYGGALSLSPQLGLLSPILLGHPFPACVSVGP